MFKILSSGRSKIATAWKGFKKLREANEISKHFSSYLEPVIADTDSTKHDVFNIRHRVYCEELGFEPVRESREECDDFDQFSTHCLIHHLKSDNFAGTVRIVRPNEPHQQLPIEKYCLSSITHEKLSPARFKRSEICEISRLAVPEEFRRRQMDKFAGAATGVINESTYSERELRCFPFIAIGLYLTAASVVIRNDIKHTYVMMEPRLARSMGFIGIKFEQLGPTVDYHGRRAPYYINPSLLMDSLTPGFKLMLKNIQSKLDEKNS